MPRRQTMITWITRAKQLADLENDDSIAAAIWKWFAAQVYGEMWTEVSLTGDRYFETSTTVNATGATSYTEQTDHLTTIRVARVLADGREIDLREVHPSEEAYRKGETGDANEWTHVDDQLFLYPKPSSGTYKWYYSQQPTDISSYADADVVDVFAPSGEAFFLWGIVVMALARQQKNVQLALQEKERARTLLQVWAANRNLTDARQRPVISDDMPRPMSIADWWW